MTGLAKVGDIVDERYEIKSVLGEGGAAVVYLAHHLRLNLDVALKIVHIETTATSLERARNEARILANLKHKNLATVYGLGMHNRRLYVAMTRVQGTTLSQRLQDDGAMPPAKAWPILLALCDAFAYLHENGVIHRDIKPSNVMLTLGDEPIIIDFGLAKIESSDPSQKLTKTGALLGTPQYMSPEMCAGKPVSKQSDIYSFGCLMYECLTGKPLYDGNTPYQMMLDHLHGTLPSLPAFCEKVLRRCLEKDPANRYSSFPELARDLSAINCSGVTMRLQDKQSKQKNKPAFVTAVLLIMVLILGLATFILTNKDREKTFRSDRHTVNVEDDYNFESMARVAVQKTGIANQVEYITNWIQHRQRVEEKIQGYSLLGTLYKDNKLYSQAKEAKLVEFRLCSKASDWPAKREALTAICRMEIDLNQKYDPATIQLVKDCYREGAPFVNDTAAGNQQLLLAYALAEDSRINEDLVQLSYWTAECLKCLNKARQTDCLGYISGLATMSAVVGDWNNCDKFCEKLFEIQTGQSDANSPLASCAAVTLCNASDRCVRYSKDPQVKSRLLKLEYNWLNATIARTTDVTGKITLFGILGAYQQAYESPVKASKTLETALQLAKTNNIEDMCVEQVRHELVPTYFTLGQYAKARDMAREAVFYGNKSQDLRAQALSYRCWVSLGAKSGLTEQEKIDYLNKGRQYAIEYAYKNKSAGPTERNNIYVGLAIADAMALEEALLLIANGKRNEAKKLKASQANFRESLGLSPRLLDSLGLERWNSI